MTPQQIAKDVERGIEIKAEMKKLKKELDAIEARLEAAGREGEQVPLQDQNREGKQFIARSSGHRLPVRFESDLIAASFDPDSPMHKKVVELTGEHFSKFFKPSNKFERVPPDGEKFRKIARELLLPEQFAALIQAVSQRDKDGIAKSKIVVAWDDAQTIPASAQVA
jgi:hypothetical protein